MPELVKNDTSFALIAHQVAKVFYFMFSLAGGGNHFESRPVEKLAVTFA